ILHDRPRITGALIPEWPRMPRIADRQAVPITQVCANDRRSKTSGSSELRKLAVQVENEPALTLGIHEATHEGPKCLGCAGDRDSMSRNIGENQPCYQPSRTEGNEMHVSALTLAMPGLTVHEDVEAGRRNLVFDGAIAAPEIHALEHVPVIGIGDGTHLVSA